MTGELSAVKLTHPQWRQGGDTVTVTVTTVTTLCSAVKNSLQISPLSNPMSTHNPICQQPMAVLCSGHTAEREPVLEQSFKFSIYLKKNNS